MQGEGGVPKIVDTIDRMDSSLECQLLCWKLNYGYRFQVGYKFTDEEWYKRYSYGYFEFIDPNQCLDFYKILECEFYSNNIDEEMPSGLLHMLQGHYEVDNVSYDITPSGGIFRTVLKKEFGVNDCFYYDKYDSYEIVNEQCYLVKVKCGNTKLSYLYTEDEEGEKGVRSLYFNGIDGWDYSDEYINNSRCIYCREYEVVKTGDNNNDNENVTESSSPEFVKKQLPEEVFGIIKGYYYTEFGDYVEIASTSNVVRYIIGGHEDHMYNEEICDYQEYSNGYLIKVEWEGEKYTYLYIKDGKKETLYIDFADEWDPDVSQYNAEPSQVYIRESADAGDYLLDGETEYYAPFGCKIIKIDEDYYLYPSPNDGTLMYVEDWTKCIPFDEPIKVSQEAVIGMAVLIEETFNGEYDEYEFVYDYVDFYQNVDNLIAEGHWIYIENDGTYFEYERALIPFTPKVTLNGDGEIIMIKDFYGN